VALEDLWPSRSGGPDPGAATTGPCQETLAHGLLWANDARLRPGGRSGGRFPPKPPCLVAAELAAFDLPRPCPRPPPPPRRDARSPCRGTSTGHPATAAVRILAQGSLEAVLPRWPAPAGSLRVAIPLDGGPPLEVGRHRRWRGRGLRGPGLRHGHRHGDETSLDSSPRRRRARLSSGAGMLDRPVLRRAGRGGLSSGGDTVKNDHRRPPGHRPWAIAPPDRPFRPVGDACGGWRGKRISWRP